MSGIKYGKICFGSLGKVIIGDGMPCLDEGYGVLKKGVQVRLD